jgi:lanthanide-dependent methanol dehydrogenase
MTSGGTKGRLANWNGASKPGWVVEETFPAKSGPLTTAGGLAFYGTMDGYFRAVRLIDGKELYKFKVGSGIIGNPMTYEHKGKQYVAVLTGVGGEYAIAIAVDLFDGFITHHPSCGLKCHVQKGGQLFVFALPDPPRPINP